MKADPQSVHKPEKQLPSINAELQRAALNEAPVTDVPPSVHEVLQSPGQPLDAETRAFFEPRFGHDFSRVRVHTDAKAAESARAVNALAYTVGQDVVFDAEKYIPGTNTGKHLMAHELAHTVQQNSEYGSSSIVPLNPSNDKYEHQASSLARSVLGNSSSYQSIRAADTLHTPLALQRIGPAVAVVAPAAGAAVTEPIEVVAALAGIASLAGQVYSGGSGGLTYNSETGDRLSDKPQPLKTEYKATCLECLVRYPLSPNVKARFEILWSGNDYGEIGAARVRADLTETSEFVMSKLDVKFSVLKNLIQVGGNQRTWQMQWDYEGTFDPFLTGEYWFQGSFTIDAFGNFTSIKHKVKDFSAPTLTIGSPPPEVQAGEQIVKPIPPIPGTSEPTTCVSKPPIFGLEPSTSAP